MPSEHNVVAYAMDLRNASSNLQSSVDAAIAFDTDHVGLPRRSSAAVVVGYARCIGYTTYAQNGYRLGQSLSGIKPPAPQEELLNASSLSGSGLELKAANAWASASAAVSLNAEAAEVTPMSGQTLKLLSKWKPGDAWPAGVPAPPPGWNPGDPITAFAKVVGDLHCGRAGQHTCMSFASSHPSAVRSSLGRPVQPLKKLVGIQVPFVQLDLNPDMHDAVDDFDYSSDEFEEVSKHESD